jgi:hypothetical protein
LTDESWIQRLLKHGITPATDTSPRVSTPNEFVGLKDIPRREERVIDPVTKTEMTKRTSESLAATARTLGRGFPDLTAREPVTQAQLQAVWDALAVHADKLETSLRHESLKLQQQRDRDMCKEALECSPAGIEEKRKNVLPKIEKYLKQKFEPKGDALILLDGKPIALKDIRFPCNWPHQDGKPTEYTGETFIHQVAVGMRLVEYNEPDIDKQLFQENCDRSFWCDKCFCARRVDSGGLWVRIVKK